MNPTRPTARPALRARLCALVCFSAMLAGTGIALAGPPEPAPEARAFMGEEKYAEAAEALRAYLKTNPYDGAAWADLGYSLHAVKRYDEAIPAYAKAIELGSHPETQMYNTACAHALSGRADDAIAWLTR